MAAAQHHAGHNRLIHETSPYLLQHADNPVDWYPWGPEAFDQARRLDRPVFLSVGYSSCHWCHVMEEESFEDLQIADFLNAHFVSIKVDREERPDIDEIYMAATQLLTGRGGWPNSIWLTSDGRPWYAGTYFPPADVAGMPGFLTVLQRLGEVWQQRRADVEAQGQELSRQIQLVVSDRRAPSGGQGVRRQIVDKLLKQLETLAQGQRAEYGSGPKFPPHGPLAVLLYEYRRSGRAHLMELAGMSLDAMAAGGIRDHVGGGFHRYAVDANWHVPHFEKMLYDNALLARTYAQAHALGGDEEYRQVAIETCDWVLGEMTDSSGGFYSALDADSEGVEGKFYLWTRREILEALGREEGELFCRAYDVRAEGNFSEKAPGQPEEANILHLPVGLAEFARQQELELPQLRQRLSESRRKLLQRRGQRIGPRTDDKVLTGWNGLMIGALAYAGQNLSRPDYVEAARRAAEFVLAALKQDGRLRRQWRQGQARLNAYLDDYAYLADGLLDLHEATGEGRWLEEARALAEVMIEHFHDAAESGFFFTADDHEELLVRWKNPRDREVPSGNAVAARLLLRLAERTGQSRYHELAEGTIRTFWPSAWDSPRAAETLVLATLMYLDGRQAGAAPQADAQGSAGPVTAQAFLSQGAIAPGGSVDLAVRLLVAQEYHINAHQPHQNHLVGTSLDLDANGLGHLADVHYPPPRELALAFTDRPLWVYSGATWITATVKVDPSAPPGRLELMLNLRVQACDDRRCLPPATLALKLPMTVDLAAPSGPPRHADVFEQARTVQEA